MSDYEYKEVDETDVDHNYDGPEWGTEPDDGNELNHAGVVHEPTQDPDAVREQEAADLQAAVDRQDVVEEYTTEDDEDGVPVIQSDHSVRFVKPGPVNEVNE